MVIQKFEDIIAWQKAQDIAVDIFSLFKEMKYFGFRDQIFNASVSISNNIAEGFDRSSDADFARFLYIALGSASEVGLCSIFLQGLISLMRLNEINYLARLMKYQRLLED